jgi:hypothetical protein
MPEQESLTVAQMRQALASRPGNEDAQKWAAYVAGLSDEEVRALHAKAEQPKGV